MPLRCDGASSVRLRLLSPHLAPVRVHALRLCQLYRSIVSQSIAHQTLSPPSTEAAVLEKRLADGRRDSLPAAGVDSSTLRSRWPLPGSYSAALEERVCRLAGWSSHRHEGLAMPAAG